jgi:DNA (cytosine-5)-methyltransferase 1
VAHTPRGEGFDASEDGTGQGIPLVAAYGGNNTSGPIDVAAALNAKGGAGRMDFDSETFIAYRTTGNDGAYETGDRVGALSTGTDPAAHILAGAVGVRRLTPREAERLMGFPDDYTAITYRGKPAADGPRYKALGNSMAVPVMAWIGNRIESQRREKP